MPAETKEAVLRTWQLLKQIPQRRPGKTVERLVGDLDRLGYRISSRQVERDLANLSRIFPLTCDDDSKPYLWYWAPNASTDLPAVALDEAVALVLVEESLKGLVGKTLLEPLKPRLAAARALLAGARAMEYVEKVRAVPKELVLHPPVTKIEVMSQVGDALLVGKQLEILYQSLQDERARWRRVNPRALLLKGSVIYLLADEAVLPSAAPAIVRQYALHRLKSCRRTPDDDPVSTRAFNLSRYVRAEEHEPGERRVLRAKFRVNAYLAKILRETPLSKAQKMRPMGEDFYVEAAVRDTNALRRWILGHGRAIEVLAPASLRSHIAGHVKDAAARY